jgi:hypothetical protein
MQNAANWAIAQERSVWSTHFNAYGSGYCEGFAEQAEGFPPPPFGTALDDYQVEVKAGRIHAPSMNQTPPVGVLVFYGEGGGDGHVAVSTASPRYDNGRPPGTPIPGWRQVLIPRGPGKRERLPASVKAQLPQRHRHGSA